MRLIAVPALAALVASLGVPCYADSLNPIVFSATLQSGTYTEQINSTPYQSSSSLLEGPGGAASMTYSLGGDPSLESMINDGFDNQGLSSTFSLIYQFEVSAPINTDIFGNFSASGQVDTIIPAGPGIHGTLTEKSQLFLIPVGGSAIINETASNSGSSSFNIDQSIDFSTNTVYTVEMFTSVIFNNTFNQPPSDFFATASLDPTITLDTTDPDYILEFSPGLIAPTPEPASLTLALTGLAGMAEALRRRSRRPIAF